MTEIRSFYLGDPWGWPEKWDTETGEPPGCGPENPPWSLVVYAYVESDGYTEVHSAWLVYTGEARTREEEVTEYLGAMKDILWERVSEMVAEGR